MNQRPHLLAVPLVMACLDLQRKMIMKAERRPLGGLKGRAEHLPLAPWDALTGRLSPVLETPQIGMVSPL